MGHYASEMCCSICGSIRCTCPPKEDLDQHKWLVDSDFTVMLVSTHDEKYRYHHTKWGKTPGAPHLRRMNMKLFNTMEEALAYRFVVADEKIIQAQKRLKDAEFELIMLQLKRNELK